MEQSKNIRQVVIGEQLPPLKLKTPKGYEASGKGADWVSAVSCGMWRLRFQGSLVNSEV